MSEPARKAIRDGEAGFTVVTVGACHVERHVTGDGVLRGNDRAAFVERWVFMCLLRHIRAIERALNEGAKRIYESQNSEPAIL